MRAFALVTKQITTRSIFKQILENTKELIICYPLKKELPFGAEREKSNFQSENEKSFQISPSRSTSQLSDPIFSISNLTQPLQGWQMNGPFIGAPIQLRSRFTFAFLISSGSLQKELYHISHLLKGGEANVINCLSAVFKPTLNLNWI